MSRRFLGSIATSAAIAAVSACSPMDLPAAACFAGSDTKACIKIVKPKDVGDLTITGEDDTESTADATDAGTAGAETAVDAANGTDAKAETTTDTGAVDAQPTCTPAEKCQKTATGLASGDRHTCAIAASNTVRCWGDNSFGQCGTSGEAATEAPTTVEMPSGSLALIASGGFHSCAAMANGDLACWGRNGDGQLALGIKSSFEPKPTAFSNLGAGIRALTAGLGHTCAVTKAGKAYCWGDNSYGQIGNGGTASQNLPAGVSGAQTWQDIAAGKYFSCGRDTAGAVWCWGENSKGQLGGGLSGEQHTAVAVKGLPGPASAVATGALNACAIMINDGSVWCWGANDDGQLGFGDLAPHAAPVKVKLPLGVATAIAVGAAHCCVIMDDDSVHCWGDGSHGQLATSGSTKSPTPFEVTGMPKLLTQLSAGAWHTCALSKNGAVACWGDSENGQLGNGLATSKLEPIALALPAPTFIAAGAFHTCAGSKTTTLQCWGDNGFQQGGNASPVVQWTPQAAPQVANGVQTLLGGGYHTCAWYGSNSLKCWGDNNDGQLGTGGKGSTPTPFAVAGLPASAFSAGLHVATGHRHTCALTLGDKLMCWGNNDFGQLGIGTKFSTNMPTVVSGGPANGFQTIYANGDRTCGMTAAGEIWCWGDNGAGQAATSVASPTVLQPTLAVTGSGYKALWLGRQHSCALASAGATVCWGSNAHGQIGLPAGGNILQINTIAALTEPTTAMALGWQHSCALSAKGTVRCWGSNAKGQLGDGTGKSHHEPAQVLGLLTNTAQITAGYMHTCALVSGAKTLCWGSNTLGQVGSGTQSIAVLVSSFGP